MKTPHKQQFKKNQKIRPVVKQAVSKKPEIRKKQYTWVYLVVLLFLTTLAFVPTLKNSFIDTWDDGVYLTENMTITQLDWNHVKTMVTTPVNATYVPIPLLSFALEYHFFKLDPFPYHLHNLILHLICTALVFYFLVLLRLNPLFALIAALFFGFHPMRVESVAWVTERKDLLFSVFYLSALISYVFSITAEKKKSRYYFLTLFFYILSLFSKIQAVTLPLSLLLLDYFFQRPLRFKLLIEKVPHFALSLLFGVAGIFILGRTGSLEINLQYSLVERLFFGLYSLCAYIFKVFIPAPMSVYYPYPVSPGKALPLIYYLSPLFLLLLSLLVFLIRKKFRNIVFGSLFFLFNIMFLLQILGAGQAYMADRFTYIPYLGVFFIGGWAAQFYSEKFKSLKPVIIGVLAILTVFSFFGTRQRCKVWKNSETLWSDVVEKFPEKIPSAYANRASFYRKTNQWPQAMKDYDVAARLDPNNAVTIMNRGNLFFDTNKDSLAYRDYMKVLSLKKSGLDLYKLYANIGAIYGKRVQYDSALYYLDLSIRLDSAFPTAYLNRGLIYEGSGKNDLAIADYQKYLTFRPEDDRLYTSIGVNYQAMRRYQESLRWFTEGIRLNPRGAVHYLNRSYSYNTLGDKAKAREDAVKSRDLGYSVPPQYLQYLGIQ